MSKSQQARAEERARIELTRKIMNKEVHVDTRYPDGDTALMERILMGDENTVKFLLENGASTSVEDGHGSNSLMFAAALSSEQDKKKEEVRKRIFERIVKKIKPTATDEEIEQQRKLSPIIVSMIRKDGPSLP